jgi:hypothetical protein
LSRLLQKRRSLLERQWPWLATSVMFAVFSCLFVMLLDAGYLTEYAFFPAILRGYTFTGLFFGVSSVGLGLLTFLYSLRKRSLQEKMPVGTMTGWLWGHVYLWLSCVLTAFLHAGYGSVGLSFTLGKAMLLLLLLLVVSGLL